MTLELSAGVSVEDALFELQIDFTVRGVEANALCPMHRQRTGKEDNNPSWWINLETGAFICFSCHYRGNLFMLVSDVKGFTREAWGITRPDYEAAKSWLMSIGQVSPDRLAQLLSAIPSYVSASYDVPEMSEAHLAIFVDPPQHALESRRISADAARKYNVLWNEKTDSWILPIREPKSNKLLGWQEKGTVERKFRNHPPGLKKSHTVFGSHLDLSDMAVVVESPLDCVRLESSGITGAVALMGSQITEDQFKLIRFSDTIIFASDNPKLDDAGKKAAKQANDLALKYGVNLNYFNYGDSGKKDPGDMTDAELRWGITNARSYLFGELAYT
jgi:hypothetical protein